MAKAKGLFQAFFAIIWQRQSTVSKSINLESIKSDITMVGLA